MKQIVDKLNKIAKKIDESVEIPQTDLIIDSLDAITKAYGGTPNDSNLIVDKLEDIYNNIGSGGGGGGVDLLHTELTIQNENSADFTFVAPEDTLLCAGYAVGTEALGSPINFLLTEIIDENDTLGIDFVTKNITIPGNSEVTFMLYYLSPTANCYIIPSLNVESVDNMELDDGAYYLIDNSANSSIILSVVRK